VLQPVATVKSLRTATSHEDFTGPLLCYVARPGNAKEFMEMVAVGVLQLPDGDQIVVLYNSCK
jgi:hypothetical protein